MQLPSVERKLAVILSADAVGYSRLMGEDEEGTLRTLQNCRTIIDGLIAEHRGRVFGSAGDSVMAEFASAVEAVRCAVEVQKQVEKRNSVLTPDRCLWFRIGINLGDVIIQGENLYGDGVNVASRLESLAEPGGICFSGSVLEQVKRKVVTDWEDLGEHEVKNIAEPIRVFRIPGGRSETARHEQHAAALSLNAEKRLHAERRRRDGRAAMALHAWSEALAAFGEANACSDLPPADLELVAEAAWWSGRMEECVAACERAYRLYSEQQNQKRAAVLCMALAEHAFHKLSHSVSKGWLKRAEQLLEGEPESIEHGYLARFEERIAFEGEGDLDRAEMLARRAHALATRFRDRDLEMLTLHDRGSILVARGQVANGLALMEQAMIAAVAGELGARTTGRIYCNMIDVCEKLAEYRRASEWEEAARRWCERVGHSSGFPGICRVRRAELMRLRGTWADAEQEARVACTELEHFLDFAAAAFQEIGEIRLLVGDFTGAEQAFGRAQGLGRDPQPGLARLKLAQGNAAAARALIDRALADDTGGRLGRGRLLPALIEIALAQEELSVARWAADELQAISDTYESTALMAVAAHARGAVQLAEQCPKEAAMSLRKACRLWKDSIAPYEEARCRLLLGIACRAQGSNDLGNLELETAYATFERLGAVLDRDRAKQLLEHP
jgi:class 3 adenylate cyclase/tetratricopeptide (TPR) repeat protein